MGVDYVKPTAVWDWAVNGIYNGDFEFNPSDLSRDQDPGWAYHGGSGTGDLEGDLVGSNDYLQLTDGDSIKTHNWFYVSREAVSVTFAYRRVTVGQGDFLEVRLDGTVLGEPILLDGVDANAVPMSFAIPQELSGQSHQLTVELRSTDSSINSEIRLDGFALSLIASEPDEDILARHTIDFYMAESARPSLRISGSDGAITWDGAGSVHFNPHDTFDSAELIISTPKGDVAGTIDVQGIGIAALESDDKIGFQAVVSAKIKNYISNEIELKNTGSTSSYNFLYRNL